MKNLRVTVYEVDALGESEILGVWEMLAVTLGDTEGGVMLT